MGRGQSATRRFDAILGVRRGAFREYDDLLASRPSARPQVKRIVTEIEEGDLRQAFDVLSIWSQEAKGMSSYIQEITDALTAFATKRQWEHWKATACREAAILQTAKGEMPFDATARRVWRAEMGELMEGALMDGSADLSQSFFDEHGAASARQALVCAFAGQCFRGGERHLTKLGGGERAMKELIGTWPPQKKIEEVFGYEDWQVVVSAWLPKIPRTSHSLSSDLEDKNQHEADRQELADIVRDGVGVNALSGNVGGTW